ncbi:MAG: DUF333 domain-containing protein [Patescibacteria group bacterium]|nr:DUF333 domain-containing protein [Patescibacteria group bacterium]
MKIKFSRPVLYFGLILLALAAVFLLNRFWPSSPGAENSAAPMMLDEQTPGAGVPEMLPEFAPPDVPSENEVFVDPMALEAGEAAVANPASANCVEQGGDVHIQNRGDGGQFGLCYFEDNRACEEWALLRGDCPVGGRRTTGYDTEAQKYCAWLGGEVLAETDAVCTLPDGRRCLAADLYQGYDCPVAASRN